ncbi:unnamed protein product [Boreogadus saida]
MWHSGMVTHLRDEEEEPDTGTGLLRPMASISFWWRVEKADPVFGQVEGVASLFFFFFLTFALLLSVSRCKYPYTSQYNSTTAPDGARRRPLVASACGCKIQLGLLSHFPLTDMYTQPPLPLPNSLETADQTADIPFQLFNLCRKYFFVKVCTPYLRHNGLQQQDRRLPSHSTYAHTRRWRVETAMRSCLLWHSK